MHRVQNGLRGKGDDDSALLQHIFEINQIVLIPGDEPQIICQMQQMQAFSNGSFQLLNSLFLTLNLMSFLNVTQTTANVFNNLNRCYKLFHTVTASNRIWSVAGFFFDSFSSKFAFTQDTIPDSYM